MANEWVVVKIFNTETEAAMAKGQLESEGIVAMIRKDDAGGMYPPLQTTSGVKLLVEEKDVEEAHRILEHA